MSDTDEFQQKIEDYKTFKHLKDKIDDLYDVLYEFNENIVNRIFDSYHKSDKTNFKLIKWENTETGEEGIIWMDSDERLEIIERVLEQQNSPVKVELMTGAIHYFANEEALKNLCIDLDKLGESNKRDK